MKLIYYIILRITLALTYPDNLGRIFLCYND